MSSEISFSRLGLTNTDGELSGNSQVQTTASPSGAPTKISPTKAEVPMASDKPDSKARTTFVTPAHSSIFSMGVTSHTDWTALGTPWKGTFGGITLGTAGTIGIAAQQEVLIVSTILKDANNTCQETSAHNAKVSLESRIKIGETIIAAVGFVQAGWFMSGKLWPPTCLPALIKIGMKGWSLGKTIAKLASHKAEDGVAIFHGDHEALISSNETVVSAAGHNNVMMAGTKAELAAGVIAEVTSGYQAEVVALGKVEMQAVGSAEVFSDWKSELVARKGTAEVLGELIEIGTDTTNHWSHSLWSQRPTQLMALKAMDQIEMKVGHTSVIHRSTGTSTQIGHNLLATTRAERISFINDKAGLEVGATGIRLRVFSAAGDDNLHQFCQPAAGVVHTEENALNTSKTLSTTLSTVTNTATTTALGALAGAGVGDAIAAGAALTASVAHGLTTGLAHRWLRNAESALGVAEANEKTAGINGFWGAAQAAAELSVTETGFSAEVGEGSVSVSDKFVQLKTSTVQVSLCDNQALAAAMAAKTALQAPLAAAQAAQPLLIATATATNNAYQNAFDADLTIAQLRPLAVAAHDAAIARDGGQAIVTDLTAQVAQLTAQGVGTHQGLLLKAGEAKMLLDSATGECKFKNGAGGEFSVSAAGVFDINGGNLTVLH